MQELEFYIDELSDDPPDLDEHLRILRIYNTALSTLKMPYLPNLKEVDIKDNKNLVSIDCSYITNVPTFNNFSYDKKVKIICNKSLIDTISSPALLKIKKKIKPKER